MDSQQQIAVVGLACRFPGARDVEEFWTNLVTGRESISFWSGSELADAGVPARLRDNPDYVPAAPVIADADRFDAGLFGMTPREAQICDPQLRLFLETCHGALEQAGYDPFAMPDSVGVFGSVGPNGYLSQVLRHRPDLIGPAGMMAQTLNQADYLATSVAYRLNLRGPAMTVLTACSSTMVTVHLACQALRLGECDSALAGGSVVRLPLRHGHLWTPGGVLSVDGHCRPFDAAASGTIFGSGAGVVMLKRLDDAIADGDHIKAVLLASAVNNDGSEKVSFSAPSVSGQAAVVMEAMSLAGTSPADIDYVEAHATGTALGDPVEVAALGEAYAGLDDAPLPAGSCVLGSVKSNIGHLDAVAGIAGFIKTVLALDREAIPATVNIDTPNPLLELAKTPFEVCSTLRPWRRDPLRPRVAGVTSLGIGGTNVHAVLTEGPAQRHAQTDDRPRAVVWSARTVEAEAALRVSLGRFLGSLPAARFADTAATLQVGRTPHAVRGAVVTRTAEEAAAALAGETGAARVAAGTAADEPRVAYLFPGQGAHHARMAAGLYGTTRAFTVPVDECIELFEMRGLPLYKQWTEMVDDAELVDPTVAQPLLFAVEYALAVMWRQADVPPIAVLGHSLGELTAAAVAGVFTLPDAVALVAARAAAMAAAPAPGGMLAVAAGPDTVRDLITDSLALATVNAEAQVVVSGPEPDLAALAGELADRRIASRRLPVGAAFHHPGWAEAAEIWRRAFDGVTAQRPRIPVFSAATGTAVDAVTLADPAFWTGQLCRPVRFHEALGALLADHPDVLLEVGPRRALTGLGRRHPQRAATTCVATLDNGRDDSTDLLDGAARLWVAGAAVDWTALDQQPPLTRVAMPGYPYERVRHWADPLESEPGAVPPQTGASQVEPPAAVDRPAVTADLGAVTEIAWREQAAADPLAGAEPGTALVLLPEDPAAATAVISAVQRIRLRPVLVRSGDVYAARGGAFWVRPGSLADLEQVLAQLDDADALPAVLLHATGVGAGTAGSAADRAGAEFASLLALSRLALGSARWPAPPRLVLVTSGSVDVTGAEPLDPGRAAVLGLLRTVRAESPRLDCAALDVGPGVDAGVLAGALAGPDRGAVSAFRGRRRWVPYERPVRLPPAIGRTLRDGGVYLITGGAGGIGLAVAEGLAGTGLRPHLVLLGRRDPAEVAGERLEALRALGAQVHPYACDVTDRGALETVLADVTSAYGPVNGVLHLAGVPGERMVAFREPGDAAAVLAPKVAGTDALERVLSGRPGLDFVVYFSSRAAVDGLVGGGDYAAANAFLDAAAQSTPLTGVRVLSIGWPVWRGAGMATGAGVDIGALNRTVRQLTAGVANAGPSVADQRPALVVWEKDLSPATDWVLDEHRMGRMPLLPGTAYIDLTVRAYREVVAGRPAPVELTDIVFREPFLDQRVRTLRITFQPDGADHLVEISSRGPESAEPPIRHATARIRTTEAGPRMVDIAGLRDRFAAAGGPAPTPRHKRLFVLGPRWQNIAATWESPGEKLVRIELAAPYRPELAEHPLYPALLDTATAAVRGPGQASSVPFLYRRLVLHESALPSHFYAHVRIDGTAPADTPSGDLDLIGDDGTVVATVEGFVMMITDEARLGPQDRSGTAAQPKVAASGPASPMLPAVPGATVAGIEPRQGVELMLTLLDAGIDGAILIRPFVDGKPLPLPVGGPLVDVVATPVVAAIGVAEIGAAAPAEPRPAEPSGDLDTRLRTLWLQALGVDEVHPDQDFFDAGGNSLTAVELMARIRDTFGVQLSIGLLLEARSFAELSEVMRQRGVV